jgi:hypothetical protein
MITHPDRKFLGFVDLDLGSSAVRVPVQAVDPLQESSTQAPLVSFECEGDVCEFLVRGDASSEAVNQSLQNAAVEALRLLSRRMLN